MPALTKFKYIAGFSIGSAVFLSSEPALASATTHALPPPQLKWEPCGEEFPGVQCAAARVPLDYDHPKGKSIDIALARVPAANEAQRIGTLFVNPGGPGGSGVELVRDGFGDALATLLDGRFDIVGFDPRGVGASAPLRCFTSEDERDAYFAASPVFPYRKSQEEDYLNLYGSLADLCFEQTPEIAEHMSTADVVRDLDLLRRAVGDKRLTYLGFSYGSYIGNTYASMFPNRVRSLVIDGVLDPRLWWSGWQILSDRISTQKEFREFLRLCDEAGPDDCALSGPDGAAARFDALVQAVSLAPLIMPDGSEFSYDVLVAYATSAMYAPENWGGSEGFGALFGALADAVSGDHAAATRAAELRKTIQRKLKAPSSAESYNNAFEAYYGNQCADTQYPETLRYFRAIGSFAASGSIFGPLWWWLNAGCVDWPVAEDRYIGPWSHRTSAPVLVVGNYFDGVTGYEGAVASSHLLRNSRLLSYAGWGHTAFGRSECVTQYVTRYLLDGSLPPRGTVCPANPNPFVAVPETARVFRPEPMAGQPPPWMLR